MKLNLELFLLVSCYTATVIGNPIDVDFIDDDLDLEDMDFDIENEDDLEINTPLHYPFLVTLQRSNDTDQFEPFCAGTILNQYTILTAAQCFLKESSGPVCYQKLDRCFRVMAGPQDHDTVTSDTQYSYFPIGAVKKHEHFNPVTVQNDIALIRLKTPLNITDMVKTVTVKKPARPPVNIETGTMVGKMTTFEKSGIITYKIQNASMELQPESDCNLTWFESFTLEQHFCTKVLEKYDPLNFDICFGDIGAPLVTMDTDGHDPCVVGINLFPFSCSKSGTGLFTKVESYNDWIWGNMNKD